MYKKKTYSKPKTSYKKNVKASVKSIRTMVKREISRNIEDKTTANITGSASVLEVTTIGGAPTYAYYLFNPVTSNIFGIPQGTGQYQRIGNTIKLKRWIIKGSVYVDPGAQTFGAGSAFSQSQGYIDIYFGRQLNLANVVSNALTGLYQNGGAYADPVGRIEERLYTINKDQYKIYWHRRYKIGLDTTQGNNDYSLNKEFGFDICKLVCKNKILKYDDGSTSVNDALVSSLNLWATFTHPNYDLTIPAGNTTSYSPVRIIANSYADYEDA